MFVRPLAFLVLAGLSLATAGRAAEPAVGDKASAPRLKVIADPADPLSTELAEEEIVHVDRIVEEVRRLWRKNPLGDRVSLKAAGDFHMTLSDMRLALSGKTERAPPGDRWLHANVDRIRFAPEAKWLVGFGTFTGLMAFDISAGGQPIFDLPKKIDGKLMRDVDISPDGDLLALILMSDGDDQTKTGDVVLWDVTAP